MESSDRNIGSNFLDLLTIYGDLISEIGIICTQYEKHQLSKVTMKEIRVERFDCSISTYHTDSDTIKLSNGQLENFCKWSETKSIVKDLIHIDRNHADIFCASLYRHLKSLVYVDNNQPNSLMFTLWKLEAILSKNGMPNLL